MVLGRILLLGPHSLLALTRAHSALSIIFVLVYAMQGLEALRERVGLHISYPCFVLGVHLHALLGLICCSHVALILYVCAWSIS